MDELSRLLHRAAEQALEYRRSLADRPVATPADAAAIRAAFGGPLPQASTAPEKVLDELVAAAEGGLVATAGPRFFGFVIGGALPAATAADILTAGWDQCAFNAVLAPAAAAAEDGAGAWLKDLLGIPASASVGFVTGAQAANTVGLAAARHHVLAEAGWDGRPDDRVPAGRQRQHGRLRRPARGMRDRPPARRLGPCRRGLRVVGRGQPDHAAPGRRRRAGRLLGLRWPQVAQRALRLGLRLLLAARRARRGHVLHRFLPGRFRGCAGGG